MFHHKTTTQDTCICKEYTSITSERGKPPWFSPPATLARLQYTAKQPAMTTSSADADPPRLLARCDGALSLVSTMLVVRASTRAPIEQVCAHQWLAPAPSEPPLDTHGGAAPVWDDGVARRLEAYGCPLALVQHHVNAGTSNHLTAAYECLLHATAAAAERTSSAGGPSTSSSSHQSGGGLSSVGAPPSSSVPKPAKRNPWLDPPPPKLVHNRVYVKLTGWWETAETLRRNRLWALEGMCNFPGCPLRDRHSGPHLFDDEAAAMHKG